MTREISPGAASAREDARQASGQFGHQQFSEEIVGEGGIDLLDGPTRIDLNNFDWNDNAQVEALVDMTYRSARSAARSTGCADRGYSVDDVAQQAILKVFEGMDENGQPKSQIKNTGAFVTHVARAAAVRAGRKIRSEDFQAYGKFNAKREAKIRELDRALTTKEEAELVQEVFAEWDRPRHLPNQDFVQRVRGYEGLADESVEVSLSTGQMQPLHAGSDTGSYVAPGSALDHALSLVEDEETRNLRAARKAMWNVVAERTGAPLIGEPSVGHRDVTFARKIISKDDPKHGRTPVAPMADKYLDGDLDADSEKALFTPWPGATKEEKESIAIALSDMPEYSFDLWDSAMLAATPSR